MTKFDKKFVKYFEIIWILETKLMVNDRKWLILRTLMRLYDKLINQMDKRK